MQNQDAPQTESFDQARYWIERHDELADDPRSVGNRALPRERNVEIEQQAIATAGVLAEMLKVPKSILDLGCGYGRVAGPFVEHGYDYLGVDVSPVAVRQAQERHPAGRFEVGDLRTWTTERRFGVVTALYVMVHFVEESDWHDMLVRALSWVAPTGILLLADEFSDETVRAARHAVQRPLSRYVELLDEQGFEFDEIFRQRFLAHDRRGSAYRFARRPAT